MCTHMGTGVGEVRTPVSTTTQALRVPSPKGSVGQSGLKLQGSASGVSSSITSEMQTAGPRALRREGQGEPQVTVTQVESSKRRPEGQMLKSWNAPWWH